MSHARRLLAAAALIVGSVSASPSLAAPAPWNAKVLWTRVDRAYVVLEDSTTVAPGTRVTFEDRGSVVASGEVSSAHDGQLVVVALTSGSLEKVKSLASVRIFAEPPTIRAPSLLRMGYPAPGRPSLLFACERVTPRPPREGSLYRVDVLSDRSYRFVRNPEAASEAPWPDTLLVRLFEVAADEEIALERGDLDVAVFWPGEPSPHIRSFTTWKGDPTGSLAGGVLVAEHGPEIDDAALRSHSPAARALRSMNEELFRGDLSACDSSAQVAAADSLSPSDTTARVRFKLNHAIPGWQVLERFLNQGVPSKPGSVPTVRLLRVHGLPDAASPPSAAPREGTAGLCVFAIRCPILSDPRLRPYLDALDPDALMRLFTCFAVSGGP
jgi:hypothetical protein